MARPAEKARAMLNKWVAMREKGNEIVRPKSGKRPMLASECENLKDAERFRNHILKEVGELISKIQNPGLGEHAIRDLNDTINKKLREKHHWNKRIKELGGPDYNAIERQKQLEEGDIQSLMGPGGYRYFGAAKDLPGVQELFAKEEAKLQKRKKEDVYKYVTPDYYGWRDEEDGVLLELEAAANQENEQIARRDRQAKKQKRIQAGTNTELEMEESDNEDPPADYLDVPTQEEVAQFLLEQKKKALLAKFSM